MLKTPVFLQEAFEYVYKKWCYDKDCVILFGKRNYKILLNLFNHINDVRSFLHFSFQTSGLLKDLQAYCLFVVEKNSKFKLV